MTATLRFLVGGGRRPRTLLVLLGAVGLALSGCGHDSGGDESTVGHVAQNVEATPSGITVSPYGTGSGFTVSTASGLSFRYNLATGRWLLTNASGTTVISQAFAAVNVDGPGYLTSDSYTTHSKSWQADVTDALGAGVQVFVDNSMGGQADAPPAVHLLSQRELLHGAGDRVGRRDAGEQLDGPARRGDRVG